MLFHLFLLISSVQFLLRAFFVISNDIRIRMDDEIMKIEGAAADSKYKYVINQCENVKIPAMQRACLEWRRNMIKTGRDVQVVRIVMDFIGEALERFHEQLSWKVFVSVVTLAVVYFRFGCRGRSSGESEFMIKSFK